MSDSRTPRLTRKPGEFSRGSPVLLPQVGSACCCCCCCLHWVGAAIGGVAGMSRAWKTSQRESPGSAPARYAVLGTIINCCLVTFLLIVAGCFVMGTNQNPLVFFANWLLAPIIFVPSLYFVPAMFAAILVAIWKERQVQHDIEFVHEPSPNTIDLACRMAWMGFWWSTVGSLIGYAIMYLWAISM